MNRLTIAPAVNINIIPMDKFKTDYLSVNFMVPISSSSASNASLLAYVLKGGCKKYPALDLINRRLEELYGAVFDIQIKKMGENHVVGFSIDFLDDSFLPDDQTIYAEIVDFLKDIIFYPLTDGSAFNETIFDTEKKNLLDLVAARINDKTTYAFKRCGELMASTQPYEVYEYGVAEIIKEITPASLYAYYQQWIETANVEIFAVGRFCDTDVKGSLAPLFNKARVPVSLETMMLEKKTEIREEFEYYPVEQAKLSIGFRIERENIDYTALTLFLILFGASAHSLLFKNVREKLSLCYYCAARIDKIKMSMIVFSGVLPQNIELAKNEIFNQLDIVKRSEFSDDDLSAAKFTFINNLKSISDSMTMLEDYTLSQILLELDVDIDKAIDRVNCLVEADVAAVAKGITPDTVFVLKDNNEVL